MTNTQDRREQLDETDYFLVAIVFGLMGAFFWAIRGTGGYGGESGGTLAGLGWAMLWIGFAHFGGATRLRPYGHGFAILAILYGIAFGGFTGYGVYIAWLQEKFYLDYPNQETLRHVDAWTGYGMLFLCGLHWGGIPGAFLAWCDSARRGTAALWVARIGAGIAGLLLAAWVVRAFPQWFLPFYDEGVYANPENATCVRAETSIRTIAPHVGLYLGFLVPEILWRNWRALQMMLVLGLGFAFPFMIGGVWQTFNGGEVNLPWWKFWEMTIGLGGGLAMGLAFYLFNRPADHAEPRPITSLERGLAGVAVLLASTSVVSNCYEGFTKLHQVIRPEEDGAFDPVRWGIAFVFLLCAATYGTLVLRRDARVLPYAIVLPVVGLIILAGYLVSWPPEFSRTNYVLLSLYTGYMLVSGGCLFALVKRAG